MSTGTANSSRDNQRKATSSLHLPTLWSTPLACCKSLELNNLELLPFSRDDNHTDEDGEVLSEDDAGGKEFEVCNDESCLDLGKDQDLGLCGDADACEKRYNESHRYVLSLLQNPDTPEEIQNAMPRCKNALPECTAYAASGKCESDRFLKDTPGYGKYMDMLTDCAPACFSCDKLLYENRCPLDPDRPRAWEQGDLNRFFLNVTTLERFRHYNATIWSRPTYAEGDTAETADYRRGPWIVTLDDFATDQECDRLIELGNNHGYVRNDDNIEYLPDGSYVTYFTKERTSYQAWCEDCSADPLAQGLTNRIEDLTGIPWTNSEPLQLLRYTNGQKYDQHHDLDDGDLYRQPGVRLMTVFLYLSDVEEGGQTHFPQLNLTFHPKRGRIVMWPNVLDENPDEADPRTEHQAMPVLQGVKYSANIWIHQYDCQTPLYENCQD